MSVWKKMNDLTKGTIDWTRDVGLSLIAGPKFFWDIATAPWNDRKEFNGFLNTISQATIDANKNTFRPLGGIVAANYATAKNILWEPAAAVTSFGLEAERTGTGLTAGLFDSEVRKKNQEQWKKAWDNRQEVPLGQGMAYSQPQNAILKGISSITDNEEFLPQYLKSDFDIYDSTQRDRAFKSSLYGKITSGIGDVEKQLFLDPSLIVGKAIKVAKMADDSFTAIKGIDAALAGEVNKYSKLGDDFAANDGIYALNHPWIGKANDPASSSYLLGVTSTKEEALHTMSALLGNPGSVAKLDILKRPDIAEPLRIASGELSRRDLKILLRDENKIATTAEEGMLDLGYLRTPEEIAADKEFLAVWAKHDKYISQLTGIASPGTAPLTQGIGLGITQRTGSFIASARSVPFHSLDVDLPSVSVYQPTPFHRAYYNFSYPLRKRPSGLMNLNEGSSINEITFTGNRLISNGYLDYNIVGKAIDDFAAAASPEAKKIVIQNFERLGFLALGKKYDISPEQMEAIIKGHIVAKDGFLKEGKETGYVYDAVNNVNITSVFFESQTSNFYPMANFDYIESILKQEYGRLKLVWGTKNQITDTLEAVNDLWKAGVLLRLGYPLRNQADSQGRILAAVGLTATLKYLGPGTKNLFENLKVPATRVIDNIKNSKNGIKPLSYEETKKQLQTLGREMAVHEKEIDKINKALGKNPKDLDAIAKLVAEQLKLDTKKVVYDANNASLTKIEKGKLASRKKGIGQGEITLPSVFDTADGFAYTINDGFAGATGELFQTLNSGERIQSRILDNFSDTYRSKVVSGNRGSVTPDQVNYYTEWAKTLNKDFSNSAVIRELLNPKNKIENVISWLKDSKEGVALRQRLGLSARDAEEYVYQASGFLNAHMPVGSGIREKIISGEKITEEFLRNAIKDPDKLPIVNGFVIEEALTKVSSYGIKAFVSSAFKIVGSMPETALARNPLFLNLYERSLAKRLALSEGLNKGRFTEKEFQDIQLSLEMGARKDALKGVNEILYSVINRSNIAETLRFTSPFLSAQLNSITTWLKLGIENPQVFSRAVALYNAPNSGGFVTDKNGDIVPPYKGYDPNDTMWFQIPKSLKKIPVVGKGLESLNEVGITKRTMDVVFMGSPLQLSIGPYISVPVSYVLKYQPKFSAVVNWAFPYGPSTDANLFFPTWLKRLTEQKMGVKDTSYANDFGLIMQTEYRKAREAKLPYPSDAEIKKKVDAFYSMRIWASLILPVTPQFESPFRLHIEKYRIYVEKYGLEAPGKFFEDYPEFFEFALSFSQNKTGVNPSMTAVENSKRYSNLISKIKDDNPALIGAIVNGSSTSKFNPTAYWWQQQTPISPGSSETFRGSREPAEAIKLNQAKEGWIKFRKVQDYIDSQLTARGLSSTRQKGAEDLAAFKNTAISILATVKDPVTGKPIPGSVSPWFEDYNDVNRVKVLQTVSGLKKVITDTTFMKDNKDNPTWKSVIVYMKMRDMLGLQLGARKSADIDAKSNSDIRFLYDVVVKKLKSDDIGFSDMYDRYLSQDTVYNKYLGVANGP